METITCTQVIENYLEAKGHIPAGSYRDRKDGDITVVSDFNAKEFKFIWFCESPVPLRPDYSRRPIFEFLQDKHANIQATKGERDFYYGWFLGNQYMSVEFIEENWPALTVSLQPASNVTEQERVAHLKEVGYEVEE